MLIYNEKCFNMGSIFSKIVGYWQGQPQIESQPQSEPQSKPQRSNFSDDVPLSSDSSSGYKKSDKKEESSISGLTQS